MNQLQKKLLKRFQDYWRDKDLAEKCGMSVKDLCDHEAVYTNASPDETTVACYKCGRSFKDDYVKFNPGDYE